MFYHSSKRFLSAAVSVTAVFFCLSELAFGFPPKRNIPCISDDGNDKFTLTCGFTCNCPPGYHKRAHRKTSARLLNVPESSKSTHKVTPAVDGETTYDFTHTLEGEWEDVVGYVGFQYTSKDTNKEYIACLIGLPVEALGNNQYKSEGWDKKIFWLDVGDGAPMHVCAIYAPNYEEDRVTYDNVYWSPNFQYLPAGVQDESQARPCELWMYLDEDDEVEEVWIDVFDENWEVTKTKELEIGDQLQAFTPLIDYSEPGSFYATSLDESFQTVKKAPVFIYEHMTPNVDFVSEITKGMDFENTDLLYILYGENWGEEDVLDFTYSTPLNINLKWGNKPAKSENWFLHDVSSVINFFLPAR